MKYLLLIPAAVFCAVFVAWPMFEVVRLSLTKTDYITTTFVGLRNFTAMLHDPAFLRSVLNSGIYIALIVPMQTGAALLVALVASNLPKRWQDATRIVFYVPVLAAGIIIAQVWRWIFHLDGLANWILGTDIAWFARWFTGIPAISLIVAMAGVGGAIIILLASILSVNRSILESATIDGASRRQIALRVVIPTIAPTIALVALLAAIAAPQIFETIYALAPYEYTATMAFRIYQDGFMTSHYGRAAAEAVAMLGLILAMTWAKNRIRV